MFRQSIEDRILTPALASMLEAGRQADRPRRPHVVIVGAGFAGLNAAMGLSNADVDVTVIDRRNYHLFQPLLYQVATAGLSPAQIATPIRSILAKQRNATVLLERVESIDTQNGYVVAGARRIPYDYLVLATGARHAYFGHDEWEQAAPGLKTISDATEIRARILTAFEKAESHADPEEQRRLLTFVVVGGGPTGVELAGAIAELSRKVIAGDFRNIDATNTRVVLVEAGARLLATFPERLSVSAKRQLEHLGVEVLVGNAVTRCDAIGVSLADGNTIESSCVLWAAGVMASRAARWLNVPADKAGRVVVRPDLTVDGFPEIFVIGDTAVVKDADGVQVPGVAPAAKQMGRYVSRAIRLRMDDTHPEPFRYSNPGSLATIGRSAAVANLGHIELSGSVAWLLWSFAHLWFLVGYRNRFRVFLDWIWAYATFDRSARLITGRREH